MPALPRVDRLKPLYTAAKALNDGYKVYGVPKTACTVRSIPSPHRIIIRFDTLSTSSSGVRSAIRSDLPRLCSSLPSIAFYTQPVRQSKACLVAEYANGREIRVNIDGESSEGVMRFVNHVVSRQGDAIVELTSRQSSRVVSVQGEWRPRAHGKHVVHAVPAATQYFLNQNQSS